MAFVVSLSGSDEHEGWFQKQGISPWFIVTLPVSATPVSALIGENNGGGLKSAIA